MDHVYSSCDLVDQPEQIGGDQLQEPNEDTVDVVATEYFIWDLMAKTRSPVGTPPDGGTDSRDIDKCPKLEQHELDDSNVEEETDPTPLTTIQLLDEMVALAEAAAVQAEVEALNTASNADANDCVDNETSVLVAEMGRSGTLNAARHSSSQSSSTSTVDTLKVRLTVNDGECPSTSSGAGCVKCVTDGNTTCRPNAAVNHNEVTFRKGNGYIIFLLAQLMAASILNDVCNLLVQIT